MTNTDAPLAMAGPEYFSVGASAGRGERPSDVLRVDLSLLAFRQAAELDHRVLDIERSVTNGLPRSIWIRRLYHLLVIRPALEPYRRTLVNYLSDVEASR